MIIPDIEPLRFVAAYITQGYPNGQMFAVRSDGAVFERINYWDVNKRRMANTGWTLVTFYTTLADFEGLPDTVQCGAVTFSKREPEPIRAPKDFHNNNIIPNWGI